MKKYILSLFTVLSFGGYALYEQRMNPSPQPMDTQTQDATAGRGRPGNPVAITDITNQIVQPTSSPEGKVPKPVPVPITPVKTPTPVITPPVATGKFKDGTYDGDIADVYYGLVQVRAVIKNGKLVDVLWLNYPSENPTSASKSARARPILTQEAIVAQDAQVDRVSGASATSGGFVDSLASALLQAKA